VIQKHTLHCYCCGEPYERGKYRCCAAPPNMASHVWLSKHCRQCVPEGERETRSHCPKHCTCPREPILGIDGFSAWRDTSLAAELARKKFLRFGQ
jgi:hypothetical protein